MSKINPFKLKAAQKIFADAGVGVGDYVKISWNYDRAYGTGTAWHEGVITQLDDWIRVEESPRAPGYLYMPITCVATIEGIEVQPAAPKKANPFLTKRKIPGKS